MRRLLGELEVPPEGGNWEGRVREAYRGFRRLARRHPNVFPLLVVRPPETMDGVWLVEEFLKTMREAGFDETTALYAFRTFSGYAMGYAMAEIRGFAMEPGGGRAGASALPAEEFPYISGLGDRLRAGGRGAGPGGGARRADWGCGRPRMGGGVWRGLGPPAPPPRPTAGRSGDEAS